MNEFNLSNFIYNLAKIGMLDIETLQTLVKILKSTTIKFNAKSISYILWAASKVKT